MPGAIWASTCMSSRVWPMVELIMLFITTSLQELS